MCACYCYCYNNMLCCLCACVRKGSCGTFSFAGWLVDTKQYVQSNICLGISMHTHTVPKPFSAYEFWYICRIHTQHKHIPRNLVSRAILCVAFVAYMRLIVWSPRFTFIEMLQSIECACRYICKWNILRFIKPTQHTGVCSNNRVILIWI